MRLTAILVTALLSTVAARAGDLQSINNRFFRTLESEAYDSYGDVSHWSKQAKHIAFLAAAHVARATMQINMDRPGDVAARAAAVRRIADLNRAFLQRVQFFAFQGYGDTDYWSKRTKQFSTEAAMHVANIAAHCDQSMIQAAASRLEQILTTSETAGFQGYGDHTYWSHRAKQTATTLTDLVNQINTELVQTAIP